MPKISIDVDAYGPETSAEVIAAVTEGLTVDDIRGRYVGPTRNGQSEVEFTGTWFGLVSVIARGLDEEKRNRALWQLVDEVSRIQDDGE